MFWATMSKTSKRKSGGESSKNTKPLPVKDSHKRPSVFERLGTKASNVSLSSLSVNISNQSDFCRNWAQNGSCPFGKSCKLSFSHILISPSKRNLKKEDIDKRVENSIIRRGSPSEGGGDWESWDQNELEYEDEKALERRRQLLQRELELQIRKESLKKEITKHRSSSTSSDSSSSSSSLTTSDSSSGSTFSAQRKIEPKVSLSPNILERNIIIKKTMGKASHKDSSPPRKSSSSTSKKASPPRRVVKRKSISPVRKVPLSPHSKQPNRSSDRGSRRLDSPVGTRGRSPEKKQSSSRSSRRSPRSSASRSRRSPRPIPSSSRNRTPERRKEDDRRKDDSRRNDRKSDFRDKREAAREKERLEALERCRERQREREALAKERERERKERDKRRRGYSSRRSPPREEKRHDSSRKSDRDRSYSRERARDRALERVMERRGSSRERSYERPYSQNSPSYRGGNGGERTRYTNDRVSPERGRSRRWVESREKQSASHDWLDHTEWETMSRVDDRGEEWYAGNGREWRARSHTSHHDERRSHHADKDKDLDLLKDKDSKDLMLPLHSKRSGDEIEPEVKKSRLDDVSLQEELSDISDDPDDILNREDIDMMDQDITDEENRMSTGNEHNMESNNEETPQTPSGDRNTDSRMVEDDGMVSLDFEEISDEELEEESKSSKGVSVVDALGVDWASLVAEWKRPKESSDAKEGSARARWSSLAVFKRIPISSELAGEKLFNHIKKTYLTDDKQEKTSKLPSLPSSLLQHKQTLSARTDIIIRRQLCGLPVISSQTHPTSGLCPWAV